MAQWIYLAQIHNLSITSVTHLTNRTTFCVPCDFDSVFGFFFNKAEAILPWIVHHRPQLSLQILQRVPDHCLVPFIDGVVIKVISNYIVRPSKCPVLSLGIRNSSKPTDSLVDILVLRGGWYITFLHINVSVYCTLFCLRVFYKVPCPNGQEEKGDMKATHS